MLTRTALAAAGLQPSEGGGKSSTELNFLVLSGEGAGTIEASYYKAIRKKKRLPEPRIGRAAVRWMVEGDRILIGNIGSDIYIAKIDEIPRPEVAQLIAATASEVDIRKRAQAAKKQPKKIKRTVIDYVRNPFVVVAALKRADGKCEVPGCTHGLFLRDTGSRYLEVHHIVPLSQGGTDTLLNVAAICPACHREHHFGTDRVVRQTQLLGHISAREAALGS
ncbi:HNH endonuclease (plasmid) [Devosia sp. A8/3-2]|nr:HNH endonuclease [Devosia sp. A8/3-2]